MQVKRIFPAMIVSALLGCAASGAPGVPQVPDVPDAPAPGSGTPPWDRPAIPAGEVAPAYLEAWRAAENRESCAPIAPVSLGTGEGSSPRVADFSGGWAVAYDRPELRSAFGIAGTGVLASSATYDAWPAHRVWRDGSRVDYGPEGGTGPNQLAYLRIAGEGCLYNVWSRLGVGHLEDLIESLRFVEGAGGRAMGP